MFNMYDKTVLFLAKAVSLIPTNYPASAIVKSHYVTKCRDAQYNKQVHLNQKSFGPNVLCNKCGNPWLDVEKIRIQSPRKKFKHQNRILQKHAQPGTKLKSLQDKINKKCVTKLLRICKYCKSNTTTDFKLTSASLKTNKNGQCTEKTPKNTKQSIKEIKTPQAQLQAKVKKKKTKDKFAGLNPNAVRQAIGSNNLHVKLKKKKTKDKFADPNAVRQAAGSNSKSKAELKNIKKLANVLKTNKKQDTKSFLSLLKE